MNFLNEAAERSRVFEGEARAAASQAEFRKLAVQCLTLRFRFLFKFKTYRLKNNFFKADASYSILLTSTQASRIALGSLLFQQAKLRILRYAFQNFFLSLHFHYFIFIFLLNILYLLLSVKLYIIT